MPSFEPVNQVEYDATAQDFIEFRIYVMRRVYFALFETYLNYYLPGWKYSNRLFRLTNTPPDLKLTDEEIRNKKIDDEKMEKVKKFVQETYTNYLGFLKTPNISTNT